MNVLYVCVFFYYSSVCTRVINAYFLLFCSNTHLSVILSLLSLSSDRAMLPAEHQPHTARGARDGAATRAADARAVGSGGADGQVAVATW